jgi:hypothetical protein
LAAEEVEENISPRELRPNVERPKERRFSNRRTTIYAGGVILDGAMALAVDEGSLRLWRLVRSAVGKPPLPGRSTFATHWPAKLQHRMQFAHRRR